MDFQNGNISGTTAEQRPHLTAFGVGRLARFAKFRTIMILWPGNHGSR